MDATYYNGSDDRDLDLRECVFCAEDGERVAAADAFDGAACCKACYEKLLAQAEDFWAARAEGPSYADERESQLEIQRVLKR
jgi:hypothetical protein